MFTEIYLGGVFFSPSPLSFSFISPFRLFLSLSVFRFPLNLFAAKRLSLKSKNHATNVHEYS